MTKTGTSTMGKPTRTTPEAVSCQHVTCTCDMLCFCFCGCRGSEAAFGEHKSFAWYLFINYRLRVCGVISAFF